MKSLGEPFDISVDRFIQVARGHSIKDGKIFIQNNLLASDQQYLLLDDLCRNKCLHLLSSTLRLQIYIPPRHIPLLQKFHLIFLLHLHLFPAWLARRQFFLEHHGERHGKAVEAPVIPSCTWTTFLVPMYSAYFVTVIYKGWKHVQSASCDESQGRH